MKNLIILIACLFIQVNLFAQNIYYDALELGKLNTSEVLGKINFNVAGGANIDAANILEKYTGGTNYNDIRKGILTNPFISLPTIAAAAPPSITPVEFGFINRLEGVNVTDFAKGLSQFLIDRANEEVNVLFFNKFRKFLSDNKEAETLFPNTAQFLINFEAHQYALLLGTLKAAFKEDLENLPSSLEDLLSSPEYKPF
jgi:hypothetical protein